MAVKAKEFQYAVELDEAGAVTAEGEAPLELADAWSPDHLLLAALLRCSLQSLRFHAERSRIDVDAQGSVSGRVAKRESDGRYAFVELECRLVVQLQPEPAPELLTGLLERAERDCFVGSSLTVKPAYHWLVNGVDPAAPRSP